MLKRTKKDLICNAFFHQVNMLQGTNGMKAGKIRLTFYRLFCSHRKTTVISINLAVKVLISALRVPPIKQTPVCRHLSVTKIWPFSLLFS